MRQKIVLGKWAVPLRVNLPNGTSFVERYERISWKTLPGNISLSRIRTIDPRNKKEKSNVCLGKHTDTRQCRKNQKWYRTLQRAQTGKELAGNLANLEISMDWKAISSILGKN